MGCLTLIFAPRYILAQPGKLKFWLSQERWLVLPMISVVVPVHNARASLEQCLQAIAASDYANFEIIVVDDCSTDDSAAIALRFPVHLLTLSGKPFGPAYARNRGAETASGEIVCFVDSDVIVHSETLGKIAQTFSLHPEYAATFGSYDEDPGEGDFLSQYKNLTHHFVHQRAKQDAGTFWSGCGAISRDVFLEMGGFNAKQYPRPSIEDIDLGCRLRQAGYKIYVNKEVQVTHLKRWTLKGWIKTDVLDRAIPWTRLIMRQRNLPNDLNLTTTQRLSALLVMLMLLLIISRISIISLMSLLLLTALTFLLFGHWQLTEGPIFTKTHFGAEVTIFLLLPAIAGLSIMGRTSGLLVPLLVVLLICVARVVFIKPTATIKTSAFALLILALASSYGILLFTSSWITGTAVVGILLLIAVLNFPLFLFFARRRHIWFALAAFPFHLMYYCYSLIAFVIGTAFHLRDTILKARSSSF
jgi:glycosyltransferase involved in cell wall biosynthesis